MHVPKKRYALQRVGARRGHDHGLVVVVVVVVVVVMVAAVVVVVVVVDSEPRLLTASSGLRGE